MYRVPTVTRITILSGILAAAGLTSGRAQDTRTITEPVFPATCAVLSAQLGIVSGEPASESAFDTARIQAALNACPTGQAVELQPSASNAAFLIQPLNIPSGVTLLVDGGVTVFASRNPADYQITGQETCGTVGASGKGCNPILSVNNNAASTGSGIMGYGIIDGRGEDKLLINGAASASSWWDIANQAQTVGGAQNNPILLNVTRAASFTLYKITFKNSPMFHVKWQNADGFTAWGVKVATPYTARNTDGIDPSGTNITVMRSFISDGDDNVALSASSATSNITIANDNTYSGHGISVGSFTQGGLTNMLVTDINQAGTAADSNGIALRIKSALDRGGLVQNVTYRNICMQNHRTLLDIDPFYNSNAGSLIPQFSNVTFRNVHGLTAGSITFEGRDANHPTTLNLDNFVFDNLAPANISPAFQFDTITLGPGPVVPLFLQNQTGSGVAYNGNVSSPNTAPYPCSAANFTFLVGELYASTSTVSNLQTATLPGPATVTLNAMVDPAMSMVTYGAYTGVPAPSASVQFFEGITMVGSAPIAANGTLASATLTLVPTGTHTYTARYPGDSTYAALNFGSVTLTVVPTAAPSTTTLLIPVPIQAGSPVTFTAIVNGTSLAAAPTGSVTFFDTTSTLGTITLGTSSLNATGTATLTAGLNRPGAHSITASYAGDPNNAPSTSPAAPVTANAIPTTTTISLSASAIAQGATATLTAIVSTPAAVPFYPTGSVTFYNGANALGSAALINGSASIPVTSSVVIMDTLSATYAASGNYAASTSAVIPLAFVTPITLSLTAYQTNLVTGAQASVTVSAMPATGFAGAVSFTCTSPVAYLTCSLSPATQTVSGSAAVQSTLTVSAASALSSILPFQTPRLPLLAFTFPLALWTLQRTRLRGGALAIVFCGAVILGISGCGIGGSPRAPSTAIPSGSQTIMVTATTGTTSQTAQLVVNVSSR